MKSKWDNIPSLSAYTKFSRSVASLYSFFQKLVIVPDDLAEQAGLKFQSISELSQKSVKYTTAQCPPQNHGTRIFRTTLNKLWWIRTADHKLSLSQNSQQFLGWFIWLPRIMDSESVIMKRNVELEKNLILILSPSFEVETKSQRGQVTCQGNSAVGWHGCPWALPTPGLGWLWALGPPWLHVVEIFTLGSNSSTFSAYP